MTVRTAVWVTEETPDRGRTGGSIRAAWLLEALARAVPTDLVISGDRGSDRGVLDALRSVVDVGPRVRPERSEVSRRLRTFATALGRVPVEQRELAGVRARMRPRLRAGAWDVACIEHLGLAPLVADVGRARSVVTLHNLASERARHALPLQPSPRHRWVAGRDLAQALRAERRAVETADRVVVSSPDDAAVLPGPAAIVPNGVDTSTFVPTPVPAEPVVVLTAALAYLPNVEGVQWFAERVWPAVREQVPAARLLVVGREPVAAVRALDGANAIEVHADVPDVRPYLQRAAVAIVPLNIGSGTRLKALEAMASGRPVVGTSIGLAGLGITSGRHALVADAPSDFARDVVRVLREPDLRARLAHEGRALVEASFDWSAVTARWLDVVLGH